jgi:SAM-dependent methyltransferase
MMSVARVRSRISDLRRSLLFRSSEKYWESRYVAGGTSGAGSYGAQAEYKAAFLNAFVAENGIDSVLEFGCGDGNQLRLAEYPSYLGLDVSPKAIQMCAALFGSDDSKSFLLYRPDAFFDNARFVHADLTLSLDVIYHLVEDEVFERYMAHLFATSDRYVIVYATDGERRDAARHVRYRPFTGWVERSAPEWHLAAVENRTAPEYQDFFVFAREDGPRPR